MKILLATFWVIPHVGGVWTFMRQVSQRLQQLGHEVDLLGNSPDTSGFHIVNTERRLSKEALLPMLKAKLDAIRAPYLHQNPIIWQPELERYCMELTAAYLGLEQYDIIHTQDVIAARALSRVKPKRTPLVAHIHGSVASEMFAYFRLHPQLGVGINSPAYRYYHAIEHYGAAEADIAITANHWQRNMLLRQFSVPHEKVIAFQYGLDLAAFHAQYTADTPVRRPPGKKVIIFPARLVMIKGIHVLVDALAGLQQLRQDWVCWIVGEGEERLPLERQVQQHGLQQQVAFLGTRHDVPALLAQSDIFVHSCLHDNQPFSVMEAQMAGLPVLVSSAGGLPEMVQHGVTGMISPVGDAADLLRHLQWLLENESERQTMGRRAQEWARSHWSLDRMMERLLDVYQGAINTKEGKPVG